MRKWKSLVKFLPSIGSWVIAGGLQVSGIEKPLLGYFLMGLGIVLLIIPFWSPIRKMVKGKPSLEVTIQDVRTGTLLYDNGQDIVQFFIHLTLEASGEIQLGALDLVVEGKTYRKVCKPEKLPTTLVKGIESYEVEYRVPDANKLLIQHGAVKAGWFPESTMSDKAYLHIIAGNVDFTTKPFLLVSHKEGSQS